MDHDRKSLTEISHAEQQKYKSNEAVVIKNDDLPLSHKSIANDTDDDDIIIIKESSVLSSVQHNKIICDSHSIQNTEVQVLSEIESPIRKLSVSKETCNEAELYDKDSVKVKLDSDVSQVSDISQKINWDNKCQYGSHSNCDEDSDNSIEEIPISPAKIVVESKPNIQNDNSDKEIEFLCEIKAPIKKSRKSKFSSGIDANLKFEQGISVKTEKIRNDKAQNHSSLIANSQYHILRKCVASFEENNLDRSPLTNTSQEHVLQVGECSSSTNVSANNNLSTNDVSVQMVPVPLENLQNHIRSPEAFVSQLPDLPKVRLNKSTFLESAVTLESPEMVLNDDDLKKQGAHISDCCSQQNPDLYGADDCLTNQTRQGQIFSGAWSNIVELSACSDNFEVHDEPFQEDSTKQILVPTYEEFACFLSMDSNLQPDVSKCIGEHVNKYFKESENQKWISIDFSELNLPLPSSVCSNNTSNEQDSCESSSSNTQLVTEQESKDDSNECNIVQEEEENPSKDNSDKCAVETLNENKSTATELKETAVPQSKNVNLTKGSDTIVTNLKTVIQKLFGTEDTEENKGESISATCDDLNNDVLNKILVTSKKQQGSILRKNGKSSRKNTKSGDSCASSSSSSNDSSTSSSGNSSASSSSSSEGRSRSSSSSSEDVESDTYSYAASNEYSSNNEESVKVKSMKRKVYSHSNRSKSSAEKNNKNLSKKRKVEGNCSLKKLSESNQLRKSDSGNLVEASNREEENCDSIQFEIINDSEQVSRGSKYMEDNILKDINQLKDTNSKGEEFIPGINPSPIRNNSGKWIVCRKRKADELDITLNKSIDTKEQLQDSHIGEKDFVCVVNPLPIQNDLIVKSNSAKQTIQGKADELNRIQNIDEKQASKTRSVGVDAQQKSSDSPSYKRFHFTETFLPTEGVTLTTKRLSSEIQISTFDDESSQNQSSSCVERAGDIRHSTETELTQNIQQNVTNSDINSTSIAYPIKQWLTFPSDSNMIGCFPWYDMDNWPQPYVNFTSVDSSYSPASSHNSTLSAAQPGMLQVSYQNPALFDMSGNLISYTPKNSPLPCTETSEQTFETQCSKLWENMHSQKAFLLPSDFTNILGKNFVDSSDMLNISLCWNVDWLRQNKGVAPTCHHIKHTQITYDDFNDYYTTYMPLLVLEAWQRIYMNFTKVSAVGSRFQILYWEQSGYLIEMCCETHLQNTDGSLEAGQFVLLKLSWGKNDLVIFGYISYFKRFNREDIKSNKKVQVRVKMVDKNFKPTAKCTVFISPIYNLKSFLSQIETLSYIKNSILKESLLSPSLLYDCSVTDMDSMGNLHSNTLPCIVKQIVSKLKPCLTKPHVAIVKWSSVMDQLAVLITIIKCIRDTSINGKKPKILVCTRSLARLQNLCSRLVSDDYETDVIKMVILTKPDLFRNEGVVSQTLNELVSKRSKHDIGNLERKKILQECDVVLSLITTSFDKVVYEALGPSSDHCLRFCIVDEAKMCTELETLIPLQYGIVKFLLFHDRKCKAFVSAHVAKQNGYLQSLSSRMLKALFKKNLSD